MIKNPIILVITHRQRQVGERICLGQKNTEIAKDMMLHIKTIESHRSKLLKAYKAKTTADFVIKYVKEKILYESIQ